MPRRYYDDSYYREEKGKLDALVDGKHCVICGSELTGRRRKYCSDRCFHGWYISVSPKSWGVIREKVLERDGHKCRVCGAKGISFDANLEVHHVVPIKNGGEEFNIANCVALCMSCHKREHSKIKVFDNRRISEFF